MKFIHLSDLHLGKRLYEYSMIEDQKYILERILEIIDDESPDAVIIAGDVYDKTTPSSEAIHLLDDFLYELSMRRLEVFVISGNHDSPDRIAFGARLMNSSGVHLSPVYSGNVEPVVLSDSFGKVFVYMLSFVKPANVRAFFDEREISSYTDAMQVAIEQMSIDPSHRNILVAHQFVTGAVCCDLEEISVGGSDNVSAAVFDGFDYVALGHIHSSQSIGRESLRYCGAPLKYSFSEVAKEKSVCVVELREKGNIEIRQRALTPLRQMSNLRGTYAQLCSLDFHSAIDRESLIHVTLTDELDIPDAAAKLRAIYPNLLCLDYDNSRTRLIGCEPTDETAEAVDPLDLFREFYQKQNGTPLSDEQSDFVASLISKIWRDE